jgi:hypothetical protein
MNTRKIIWLSPLPMLIVGIYIYRFGLNIPFWDQWEVVSFLMKKHQGLLTLSDLFAQHNEHRPFFPNLIWIGLSGFTHYNVKVELWVNLLIALGSFLFFIKQVVKTWVGSATHWPPFLIPLLSLLIFNLGQYESWLQGVQTIMFLEMACVLLGIFLLAESPALLNFISAILLGVIATFSMANGLFYWPIGLGIIAVTAPHGSRITRLAVWLICSSICIGLFLYGWKSQRLDFDYILTHLMDYFLFILNFLGSPINALGKYAWIFGCLGLGLAVLVAGHVIKTKSWIQTAPYLGIILFVLLSSLSVAAGRLGFGLEQARVSRYQTISIWYWASLIALLPPVKIKDIYKNLFYLTVTLALTSLMYTGYLNGQLGIYQRTLPAYQALIAGKPVSNEALLLIYPKLDIVRPRLEFLCENHLSVCADLP